MIPQHCFVMTLHIKILISFHYGENQDNYQFKLLTLNSIVDKVLIICIDHKCISLWHDFQIIHIILIL